MLSPVQGRLRIHAGAVLRHGGVAHVAVPPGQAQLPVGRRGLQQAGDVGHAHDAHRAGKHLGREGGAHQGRIAAVAGTVDRHTLRVGHAALHRPAHAVHQIVVHAARELAPGFFHVVAAIAAGAPVVDLQHRIAPVGQKLLHGAAGGAIAPAVTCPRAAMHQQHGGQPLRRCAHGQHEVAVDGETIARGVGDGRGGGQVLGNQAQPVLAQKAGFVPIAQQVVARAPVGGHRHREHLVGLVQAGHQHLCRLVTGQRRQPGIERRVEHLARGVARHEMREQRLAGAATQRHVVQIHIGRGKPLFLGARGQVQPHQRQLVAAPVRQGPGLASLVMQAKDVQRVPPAALCHRHPGAWLGAGPLQQHLLALDLCPGAQLTLGVHTPPVHVAGVGGQQHRRATCRVHAVQVKHLLVALVGGDDEVGRGIHRLRKMRHRTQCWHQLAQVGTGALDRACVDAGVFVARGVGRDAEPAAVGTEADGARTDAKRLGVAPIDGLHPDRRHHAVGAKPGNALSIRRHAIAPGGLPDGHKVAHGHQVGQLRPSQRWVRRPGSTAHQGQCSSKRCAAPPSPHHRLFGCRCHRFPPMC